MRGERNKIQACRKYGLHGKTLEKILRHEEPPGYRRRVPRQKPKIGPFLDVIHQILESDRTAPKKPRHTAKRIFERLRQEHRYPGDYSAVKEVVSANASQVSAEGTGTRKFRRVKPTIPSTLPFSFGWRTRQKCGANK